jgi:hypothetical protein
MEWHKGLFFLNLIALRTPHHGRKILVASRVHPTIAETFFALGAISSDSIEKGIERENAKTHYPLCIVGSAFRCRNG